MERVILNNTLNKRTEVYREQLITIEDMESFKTLLLREIRTILNEFTGKSDKKWLKSYEVKKLLGISAGTLQNLRINGTLPYTKIGGVILYDSQDIENMLRAHRAIKV